MGEIVQNTIKVKGVADIVFCIDATGSMGPCIDQVKKNVETFARSIQSFSANTKVDWRAQILGYRDFDVDTEYLVNTNPFVTTPDALAGQLQSLIADGGGDEPESTLDAILYAIKKSGWRTSSHRVVVVFTDATPKPNLHSRTVSELGVPSDIEIIKQVITDQHIKLFLFGPKSPVYDELATIGKATIVQFEDATLGLSNADFKSILDTIGKTVSQAVSTGGVV